MNIHNFFSSKKTPKSATEAVKEHLIKYGKLDQLECIERFGTWRLGAIIFKLRRRGMNITTKEKEVKTRYGAKTRVGVYYLG